MITIPVSETDNQTSQKAVCPAPLLFTIGYEGLALDEYIRNLTKNEVSAVIDVRRNPISRKKGFSKTALSSALSSHGIEYVHLPGLGIESSLRRGLSGDDDYRKLFAYYTTSILSAASDDLERIVFSMKRFGSVALTCFEHDPRYCHRHCIAEMIFMKGLIESPAVNI